MGNQVTGGYNEIKIWHKFSPQPPRGWPQNGCLYFKITNSYTINDLLREINKHRRPDYQIFKLFDQNGHQYSGTDLVRNSDLYV